MAGDDEPALRLGDCRSHDFFGAEEYCSCVHILLAEHPHVAGFTALGLREHGHTVDVVFTTDEALLEARSGRYDVLILASAGPPVDGISALRDLRRAGVSTPGVLLTPGVVPPPTGLGKCATLPKPFTVTKLVEGLATLLD